MYGDVNTGGITGSMTIEYTLDPEDDVTGHLSNIYRKQYEYRSIIQKCVNTGDVAGKSVVEVYAQTPYGDYEKQNSIEKSAVQVVGFEKTDTLEPGQSQTVTVECERYMLASYDSKGAQGYILSAGDYYLAVGDDSHDALRATPPPTV